MKKLSAIVLMSLSTSIAAEINKCVIDGKTVFQDSPCVKGVEHEFELTPDISIEKQQAAAKALEVDLERWNKDKQLKRLEENEERKIQAMEDMGNSREESSEPQKVYGNESTGIRTGVDHPLLKRRLIKKNLIEKRLPSRVR